MNNRYVRVFPIYPPISDMKKPHLIRLISDIKNLDSTTIYGSLMNMPRRRITQLFSHLTKKCWDKNYDNIYLVLDTIWCWIVQN